MYYSQLVLNRFSDYVRRDIGNVYQLHRTIYSAFGDMSGMQERILFRLEKNDGKTPSVLVQSMTKPDWSTLDRFGKRNQPYALSVQVKEIDVVFTNDSQYKFRLVAEAKKVSIDGKRKIPLYDPADQLEWIQRKAKANGFFLNQVFILNNSLLEAVQGNGNVISLNVVHFEGVLTVTELEKFMKGYCTGLGHGKGFGLGMLSLIKLC